MGLINLNLKSDYIKRIFLSAIAKVKLVKGYYRISTNLLLGLTRLRGLVLVGLVLPLPLPPLPLPPLPLPPLPLLTGLRGTAFVIPTTGFFKGMPFLARRFKRAIFLGLATRALNFKETNDLII